MSRFASDLYSVLRALAAGLPLVAGVVICSLEISGGIKCISSRTPKTMGSIADPLWMDTVNVPYRGSVDAVMDFTAPVIRCMSAFHCHLANREDKGMMTKIVLQ